MIGIYAFIKRAIEINESSIEYITEFQGINAAVSAAGVAIAKMYTFSIEVVNVMIETMAVLGQRMLSFLLMRSISDLITVLQSVLESGRREIGKAITAGLEPSRVSIFWRFIPPRDVIAKMIRRLRERARKLRVPSYEDVATISSIPQVIHPPSLKTLGAIGDQIRRMREVGRRTHETAPAVTVRVGISRVGKVPKTTRGVFDTVRRSVAEARWTEALEVPPPRFEVLETARDFSEKSMAPLAISALPIIERVKRRYVGVVSEAGRITQPLIIKVAETYGTRVLEPASKVSRFVDRAPNLLPRAMEMVKEVEPVPTTTDMERGLRLVREGAEEIYTMEPTGLAPQPTKVVRERVERAPVRVAFRYTPLLMRVERLGYDLARRVSDIFVITRPRLETGLVDTSLEEKREDLYASKQKMAEIYLFGAPVGWTPSILEAARVLSDRIGITSRMVRRGLADYRLGISSMPSVTWATKAVPGYRGISDLTGRVYPFRAPVVERAVASKHVQVVPEVKRVFRPIAERVAEIYRYWVLSLSSPPFEVVAEKVVKAPVSGLVEVPRVYPAMKAVKMATPISIALSKVGEWFPSLVKEKYLETAGAPSVREYLEMVSRLGVAPGLGRVSDLMKGRAKGLSRVAARAVPPPSLVEMVRASGGYVGSASEAGLTSDVLRGVPREVIAYGVDVSKAFKSSIDGEVLSRLRTPVGRYAQERVSVRGPTTVPTVKLHEIIPFLYSVPSPKRIERPKTTPSNFNININVESLRDESDIRELERRITRILKEEARRHGVRI